MAFTACTCVRQAMGCEPMNWIRAERRRPQFACEAQRIVGLPKTRASHAVAELRPLFFATRGISLPTAFKLVPVKRSALTPELKAFIDHAIVPALVKAYLAARGEE